MQSQQRTPTSFVQAILKKTLRADERREAARSAPVELDVRQLRHVAGGNELPKKVW